MTDYTTLPNGPPMGALTPLGRRVRRHVTANRDAILSAWYTSQFDADRLRRYAVPGTEVIERDEVIGSYLSPLLELLTTYLENGDEGCRAVYLDERLRYAPHQSSLDERVAFFTEVLPPDETALLAHAEGIQADLAERLQQVHAPLIAPVPRSPVRLLAVGDCLLGELRVFLPSLARTAGIALDMRCLYFSALLGRDISTTQVLGFLNGSPMDLLSFSFLTYEGIPPYAALLRESDGMAPIEMEQRCDAIAGTIRRFLEEIRRSTDVPFLLHNACGLPLTRFRKRIPLLSPLSPGRRRAIAALNVRIAEIVSHTPNTLLIDEAQVVAERGYRAATAEVVSRARSRGPLFHNSALGRFLADPYLDVLRSFGALHRAKVLCIDLDNTLWDGVMADGAVRHYYKRQELLRRAREAGLLLVTVSKNSPDNIRWQEMKLEPDDFVLHKIAWDLKVQSIRQAAEQLDLGLDSFVFIDDNPAERELVRTQLPLVTTLDATDPHTWRSVERVLRFPNTKNTDEARQRTELYRQQAQRREALSTQFDYPAMMVALDLVASFSQARPSDVERVAELIQRTNQFNTTTKRYTKLQLQGMLEDDTRRVYVADLADKFGALGLVAVAIIARDGHTAVFDSFVMSCRAMGFQLEQLVTSLVLDAESDAERFVGRFVPTDRNTPAMNLYTDCGFESLGDGNFELHRTNHLPKPPAWFTVRSR